MPFTTMHNVDPSSKCHSIRTVNGGRYVPGIRAWSLFSGHLHRTDINQNRRGEVYTISLTSALSFKAPFYFDSYT